MGSKTLFRLNISHNFYSIFISTKIEKKIIRISRTLNVINGYSKNFLALYIFPL